MGSKKEVGFVSRPLDGAVEIGTKKRKAATGAIVVHSEVVGTNTILDANAEIKEADVEVTSFSGEHIDAVIDNCWRFTGFYGNPVTHLREILVTFVTFICIFCLSGALWRRQKHQKGGKLPPGPKPFPIIGSLHMIGALPYRSLAKLAQKYGPIMSLNLGNVPTIVISSPQGAELVLKTHDAVFAGRPKSQASELLHYGSKGFGLSSNGSYWRNVRKFCTLQLLSAAKIEMFSPMRKKEIGLLVEEVKEAARRHEVVDITEKVNQFVENMTYRMVLGTNKDDEFDLKGLFEETLVLVGAFNLSDFVPFLAPFDFQGYTKRMKNVSKSTDQLLEKIISQHEKENSDEKPYKDFVDTLLSMLNKPMTPNDEDKHIMDKTQIKAIVVDMLAASLDSSAKVSEWILAELLRHPRVMARLQEELDRVVGKNRMVEEKDLVDLPYLDMIIKENFRMYPIAPLLIPHESMEDITIDGFHIPNKSRIIVNLFAMGRDPSVWSHNVEEFYPERFIDSNVDLKGHNFELIPFGSGRRGCPGMQLGLTNVKLVVSQVVHCFDWKLPNGMSPDEMDMSEHYGISLSKVKHVFAIPSYRLQV
ncbi:hypothetical protein ACFE04_012811 [Oxalis oulophora]